MNRLVLGFLCLGALAACGGDGAPAAPPPATTPAPPPPAPEPAPEPPGVPSDLRVSASGEHFIEWTWTAVEGADGYDVQFSPNEAFTSEDEIIPRTAEELSYRREGLAAGISAYLRVRSASGTGGDRITSDWSTHVTGMTVEPPPPPEPPAVPTGLHVSANGEDFVEWTWDAVDGADGYDVQFSPNEAFSGADEIIPRTAEELSYRREDLASGTSAYLRVRSASGTAEDRITSDWSTHVTGMTVAPPPPPEPPAVPTGLHISANGEDFVEWTWDAVDGADGYDVQFSPNEAFTGADEIIPRTSEELSYRREDLASGTSAYLRVRSASGTAEDRITSDWSTHVSGMTAEPPAPPAPTRTWRGLTVAPEERCSHYDSDDYRYSQSVEADIVRDLGGIYSPYTCETFDSTRETDIEHIVARSEAHDSGLCSASAATRRQFAEDLLNLTLASPSVNRHQKVDKDAAEWLPDQNRCWFAQTVVDVRLRYGLTIDQAEADSLDRILAGCRSTEISCDVPPPPPVANHPPIRAYPNCTEMRRAGWTRGVNRSGGTYQDAWDEAERQTYALNTARDRDKDGHACET